MRTEILTDIAVLPLFAASLRHRGDEEGGKVQVSTHPLVAPRAALGGTAAVSSSAK